ncbi:MAG: hypothetical protein SNJ75_18305, partial [Gemmataceae bacterium]
MAGLRTVAVTTHGTEAVEGGGVVEKQVGVGKARAVLGAVVREPRRRGVGLSWPGGQFAHLLTRCTFTVDDCEDARSRRCKGLGIEGTHLHLQHR